MILRELLLKLGLDLNAQSFLKGELAAKGIEKALDLVVDKAKELKDELIENVKGVIEYGDELNKAAQSSGIARDALQELRYAASLADISSEEMTQSLNFMTRTMREAKEGSAEQAKAFQQLGIRITDTHGKLRGADDVMGDVAEKLSKMPDGAEKTAKAMQIFGRAGARMIPLLNEGADGLAEMRQEARELGLVMDDEAVKASEELNDNLTRLRAVGQGLWRQAIAPLIPALNHLVKRFLEWRKANAAIMAQKIRQYIGYVVTGIEKLADVFSFLVRNATAVKIILASTAIAFAALNTAAIAAAASTAAAWAVAAAPFVALAGIIAGIMLFLDDIRVYKRQLEDPNFKGKSVFGLWAEALKKFAEPNAKDPWWLAALRSFVKLLNEAVEVMTQFDVVTGKWKPAIATDKVNANSPAFKRNNTPAGPKTFAETLTQQAREQQPQIPALFKMSESTTRFAERAEEARMAGQGWWDQFKAGFGYGDIRYGGQSGGGNNVTIAPQMNVKIDAAGMPAEQLRPMIREEFDRMTDKIHEDALAGVTP